MTALLQEQALYLNYLGKKKDFLSLLFLKNNQPNVYIVEYYSAIERNEIELLVMRWMDLESVIQSEVSQKEKNKYCMLTNIYGI